MMKKKFLVFLTIIILSGNNYSQSVGVFLGYGASAFGDDFAKDIEQANYIPLGANILFKIGAFQVGGEINYAIAPFTFEGLYGDVAISQLYFGALAKYKIGSGRRITPYLRLGAGLYTGSEDFTFLEGKNEFGLDDYKIDFKNAFGFNLGAGGELKLNRRNSIFAEFVYHVVNRELDTTDTENEVNKPFSANNWALHFGFKFGL